MFFLAGVSLHQAFGFSFDLRWQDVMSENVFPIDLEASTALADIDSGCWRHLCSAVDDSRAAWRLPCLATQSGIGCRQRTVVLRAVDPANRLLLFHTDARSEKVLEIRQHANVSLLFYDPEIKVQVVAQGMASLHTDDSIADRLWCDSTPASLKMYLGELPPGAITAVPSCNEPSFVQGRVPLRTEIEAGRRNFAVVVVSVSQLDWLQLSRDGNYRARNVYVRDGTDACSVQTEWLAP